MEEIKVIIPNRKAVAYYRVSTEEQRKKESIGLQKTTLHELAEEEAIDIIGEFADDGISGEEISKRPGFQDCLDFILNNEVDLLLVYLVDRIGRFKKRRDRNRVIETLEDNHVSVMDSERDLWRWDNEKEMNNLEGELNDARQFNVKLAKRVKAGHKRVREAGGFSGGRTPYGIRYTKEKGFEPVPHQVETLRVIFGKFLDGWGTDRIVKFLNDHRDRFPAEGFKKTKGKWMPTRIEHLVGNDFYFSGLIYPKQFGKEKKDVKDLPPSIDTGIKLFPQELIEQVRRERSKRVIRKKGDAEVIRMDDYLVLGLARCSDCNWKLGLWSDRKNPTEIRRYYICKGKKRSKCNLPAIRTTHLDDMVWKRFSEINKDDLQEAILQTSYVLDTDAEYLESRLLTIGADLGEIEQERKRILQQHRKGYIGDGELDREIQGVLKKKAELEADKERCEKALYQKKDVTDSVEKAVNLLNDQIDLIELLERYPEDPSIHEQVAERLDILKDVYLSEEEVSQTVNRLKRRLMKTFIDPERGIEIKDKDHFTIHGITGQVVEGEISNKSL